MVEQKSVEEKLYRKSLKWQADWAGIAWIPTDEAITIFTQETQALREKVERLEAEKRKWLDSIPYETEIELSEQLSEAQKEIERLKTRVADVLWEVDFYKDCYQSLKKQGLEIIAERDALKAELEVTKGNLTFYMQAELKRRIERDSAQKALGEIAGLAKAYNDPADAANEAMHLAREALTPQLEPEKESTTCPTCKRGKILPDGYCGYCGTDCALVFRPSKAMGTDVVGPKWCQEQVPYRNIREDLAGTEKCLRSLPCPHHPEPTTQKEEK